jgi:Ca2+-binding RTX toxin-like protein
LKRTLAIISAAILGSGLLHLSVAVGATTCSFGSATVTITVSGGTPTTIVRSGEAIDVSGSTCGAATITNTDTIDVTVSDTSAPPITIDLSGGPFAPGATNEGDESSEIEFQITLAESSLITVFGSAGADFIDAGVDPEVTHDTVLNLNGDESVHDPDVTIGPPLVVPSLEVEGRGGPDLIELEGDPGSATVGSRAGSILHQQGPASDAVANGGAGNDTIDCSGVSDTLRGGGGSDTVSCWFLNQNLAIQLYPTTPTTISYNDPYKDTISGFENAVGGHGNDVIAAIDPEPNALHGGPGDDTLVGGGGDDLLDGGPDGSIHGDAVAYNNAPGPVSVDLAAGTAMGDGHDTLVGIEEAGGSPFDDTFASVPEQVNAFGGLGGNDTFVYDPFDFLIGGRGNDTIDARAASSAVTIDLGGLYQFQGIERILGSAFADTLSGSAGAQDLVGRAGADEIKGRAGSDTLWGGVGRDALDGGTGVDACTGGPGSDTLARCEL